MASSTKRSWRLQEFAAHASNVNCLALGHKSGRVLVTGGDDKKVNLWAVGKPNCIMSLPGHTTPVECVQFSISEELVCAGSQAGALKLWDLEAAKIFRTLTGHKAGIRCIDFHPYGDFLTTGSMDCSVRLWDIRRKGCIYTYSAHKPRVNSVKFSPDGQWVASAGEDGDVKLWDLRVGKLLKEFPNHGGAVTSVAFHPNEFLLASSSADKTVKFWDLERFALISSTEPDVGGVRCAVFSEGGECLFAGSQDRLKVYGWEPTRTHDTVPIGWGRIQDIAVAQNQLIGASFHTSMVAINVVDLKRVQPFGGAQSPDSTSFTPGQSLRKSFSRPRTREEQVKLAVKTIEEAVSSGTDPEDESLSLADIPNIGDYQEIFQPNRKLCRTPPPEPFPAPLESLENDPSLPQILQPSVHSESDDSPTSLDPLPSLRGSGFTNQEPPFRGSSNQESAFRTATNQEAASRGSTNQESAFRGSNNQDSAFRGAQVTVRVEDSAPHGLVLPNTVTVRSEDAPSSLESLDSPTREEFVSPTTWTRRQSSCLPPAFPEIDFPVKLSNMKHSPSEPSLNRPSTAPRVLYQSRQNLNAPAAPAPKPPSPPAAVLPVAAPSARPAKRLRPPPPSAPKVEICVLPPAVKREPDEDAFIPMSSDRPSGLDLDDFLPRNHSQRPGFAGGYPDMSEAEVLSSVVRGHEPMMSVLGARQRSLQIVYSTMINKDMRAAVDTALAMNDRAVVVDLLEAISAKPSIWTLDICAAILPSLLELLQSKFEMYMTVGCTTLRLILRNFAPVIRSNVQGGRSHGVDISAEERYTRCKRCYDALVPIRAFLLKRQTMQGKLGQSFRELSTLMENLD